MAYVTRANISCDSLCPGRFSIKSDFYHWFMLFADGGKVHHIKLQKLPAIKIFHFKRRSNLCSQRSAELCREASYSSYMEYPGVYCGPDKGS